jgi:hypothetical protein
MKIDLRIQHLALHYSEIVEGCKRVFLNKWSIMVTICTMCFDVKISLHFLPTQCSCIFGTILTKNSEYFPKNIRRLVFVRETQSFLWGTIWVFYMLCRGTSAFKGFVWGSPVCTFFGQTAKISGKNFRVIVWLPARLHATGLPSNKDIPRTLAMSLRHSLPYLLPQTLRLRHNVNVRTSADTFYRLFHRWQRELRFSQL